MKKPTSPKFYKRKGGLSDAFRQNPSLLGELIDARICNQIAIDLHHLRVSKNVTQKELAEMLGVQQSNISRWETLGYQGYKVKVLSKITRMLGGRLDISINLSPTYNIDFNFDDLNFDIDNKHTYRVSGFNSSTQNETQSHTWEVNYAKVT